MESTLSNAFSSSPSSFHSLPLALLVSSSPSSRADPLCHRPLAMALFVAVFPRWPSSRCPWSLVAASSTGQCDEGGERQGWLAETTAGRARNMGCASPTTASRMVPTSWDSSAWGNGHGCRRLDGRLVQGVGTREARRGLNVKHYGMGRGWLPAASSIMRKLRSHAELV
ncbi:hypothetical protein PR202_ga24479 [Eleusine coracana subsp. coracana]|uniref:Uncharacterized protein n=1 Tax=Eleusine coracana subsp. coracana TaxID=191504 RepID=A0AAV5D8E8_ELECO|nr:hypothetical protein PR202_ga24479 [Eleusine coracana subsp. coracana]